jgi:hypothetical protein
VAALPLSSNHPRFEYMPLNPYGSIDLINDEREPWRWWFGHKDFLRDMKNAAVEGGATMGR